jgi:hypothetical protein
MLTDPATREQPGSTNRVGRLITQIGSERVHGPLLPVPV